MSEPGDDMSCSELEQEIKVDKEKRLSLDVCTSPLRKLVINQEQVTSSPLKDIEDKMSPQRESIHEMISAEVSFDKNDITTLITQIEQKQTQIDQLTQQLEKSLKDLAKERKFRIHIQKFLRN